MRVDEKQRDSRPARLVQHTGSLPIRLRDRVFADAVVGPTFQMQIARYAGSIPQIRSLRGGGRPSKRALRSLLEAHLTSVSARARTSSHLLSPRPCR